jgi:hypothetical protein
MYWSLLLVKRYLKSTPSFGLRIDCMCQDKNECFNEIKFPSFVEAIEELIGKLFIAAFLCNKLRDFPIGFLDSFLANVSIICLALAYSLQLISTPFYQHKNKSQDQNLINYRNLCILIAFIGALNSWICIIYPQLWLQSLWVFCANNLIWIYNETTRKQEQTLYPKMPENQDAFISYVSLIGLAPFCTAIASHLKKVFLEANLVIDVISKIINWTLTIFGFIELNAASKPKFS